MVQSPKVWSAAQTRKDAGTRMPKLVSLNFPVCPVTGADRRHDFNFPDTLQQAQPDRDGLTVLDRLTDMDSAISL